MFDEDDWISVDDEFPSFGHPVLVFKVGAREYDMATDHRVRENGVAAWSENEDEHDGRVTHWTELPRMPKT